MCISLSLSIYISQDQVAVGILKSVDGWLEARPRSFGGLQVKSHLSRICFRYSILT